MGEKTQYQELISDVISKQSVILGPEIAILKAKSVSELIIDDNGKVTNIKGDPQQALQKLVDAYVALSGQIVKIALGSLFEKYPDIKKVN